MSSPYVAVRVDAAEYAGRMAQKKSPGGREGGRQGVDPEFIGRRIVERRDLIRMTQEQLAERIGRAQSNVSAYETGASVPNLAALRLLAIALRTTIDHLVGVDVVREQQAREAESPKPPSGVIRSRPPSSGTG